MSTISFKDTAAILSAMIIPVVLIMATLSLILTTSQRSGKVMDRVRELFKKKTKENGSSPINHEEAEKTIMILQIMAKRSKYLQHSLWFQYLALSDFLATSICLTVIKVTEFHYYSIPLILGVLGIILLFGASIMLVLESRLAIKSLDKELKHAFKQLHSI